MKELIDGLNDAQRDAVLWHEGPLLVLAGAGSGKTRVLTLRLAHLVEERGVSPWELLAVTFTNKAAGEMKERVERQLGPRGRDVWVSTFHSTCLRILRQEIGRLDGFTREFVIYDDRDSRELIKRILKDGAYPSTVNPSAIRGAIDRAKNEARSPRALLDDPPPDLPPRAGELYALYQERLRASNALDFGDLIFQTLRLLEAHEDLRDKYRRRFRHLLVDEYQDTNHVQYRLIRLLADHGTRNVCVVGDEDQSIYSFRGADIRNILDFERDFPGAHVVRLERNYRSSEVILRAAGAVVSQNMERLGKTLWTERAGGELIRVETAYDDREEARCAVDIVRRELARGMQPRDVAVFYRTNAMSRLLEEEFMAARLPFVLVGGQRFFDRKEVKDALSYLKLLVNPHDEIALRRVINEPPRGIGEKTIAALSRTALDRGQSLWEALDVAAGTGKGRSASALRDFRDLVRALRELARSEPLPAVLEAILERTGMIRRLQEEESFDAEGRVENLQELMGATAQFAGEEPPAGLLAFLDRVSLVADTDKLPDEDDPGGKVTLMTVHSAKGLEFPVVLVVGMDEKVFPHARSLDFQSQLEEERRLAYVAITRAEDRLYLLRARRRPAGHGQGYDSTVPSRFLRAIPGDLLLGAEDLGVAPPLAQISRALAPGDSVIEYDRSRGTPPSRFSAVTARRQQSLHERQADADRRTLAAEVAARSDRFSAPAASALSPAVTSTEGSLGPAPARAGRSASPGRTPAAADPDGDRRVIYDVEAGGLDEAAALMSVGTRVLHPDFGEGEVRSVEGAPGNRRATIFFRRGGLRRLYLRSANLEILSH